MNDDFYTPTPLASDLIKLSRQSDPERIADFAVGDGSLLSAANLKWPNAELLGLDLNLEAVKRTELAFPKIKLFNSDYLSDNSFELTSYLLNSIDLIVLNTPFSCRGGSFHTTTVEDNVVKSSKAMAFILRSLQYMSLDGEILAIVPRSCLFSQKDHEAREAMADSYKVEDFGEYKNPCFKNASVVVHLIRVTNFPRKKYISENSKQNVQTIKWSHRYSLVFMRGSHTVGDSVVKSNGPSLIHTTDLFNSEISISRKQAVKNTRLVSGKVLMLPRVSKPSIDKISVGSFIRPVVPSDCIICVKTIPPGHEEELQVQIKRFWSILKKTYSGTCAPYLTLKSFEGYLKKIGFEVELTTEDQIWNPIKNDSPSEHSLHHEIKS